MKHVLLRRAASEFFGTFFLLAAVVGSGIMAERLAAGNREPVINFRAGGAGSQFFSVRGETHTGCLPATNDDEMWKIDPSPPGCGANRAQRHTRES
jgi:hypothetical protein